MLRRRARWRGGRPCCDAMASPCGRMPRAATPSTLLILCALLAVCVRCYRVWFLHANGPNTCKWTHLPGNGSSNGAEFRHARICWHHCELAQCILAESELMHRAKRLVRGQCVRSYATCFSLQFSHLRLKRCALVVQNSVPHHCAQPRIRNLPIVNYVWF